jgi:hypothetical protein
MKQLLNWLGGILIGLVLFSQVYTSLVSDSSTEDSPSTDIPSTQIASVSNQQAQSQPQVPIAQNVPSNWTKRESVDQFTDQVSRSYSTRSPKGNVFIVMCDNELVMAFGFPKRSGTPSRDTNPEIRIDRGEVITYTMYTSWVSGNAFPDEPANFYKLISGKSTLAVDILAAVIDSFNITGIDAVISDMKPLCDFAS